MTTTTRVRFGITDLVHKGYLPNHYSVVFRPPGSAAADALFFDQDITTLLPPYHRLLAAQRYHFQMMACSTGVDGMLKRYCQAALNLNDEEWVSCADDSNATIATTPAVDRFIRTKRALFFDQ